LRAGKPMTVTITPVTRAGSAQAIIDNLSKELDNLGQGIDVSEIETMVREKLKDKSGKQYWRTLEELSEDPHFEELLHREFPRHASEWDDAVDRRDFLKLMGASLALAGR